MFVSYQDGSYNKDDKGLEYYLEKADGFKSSFPDFKVIRVGDFNVIDESQSCEVGYKARAGEMLVQKLKERGIKEIVYVQPRQGFAGISLSYLCKKYGLSLTLVMPSSKEVSPHQLVCIELGAKPIFVRIAAMPNAQLYAKKYAMQNNAYYIPMGLYHEDVIACGVKLVHEFFRAKDMPKAMWSVISTGVLTRTLQIALPYTEFIAVGVARNIQHGELGRAKFISYDRPFNQASRIQAIEFDSEKRYDLKGWEVMLKYGKKESWFFNVAGEAPEAVMLSASEIDSYRAWNDFR